jgi:hypothetical protein
MVSNDPPRRTPSVGLDDHADPASARNGGAGAPHAARQPTRRRLACSVHESAERAEPGVAAGLLQVRDATATTGKICLGSSMYEVRLALRRNRNQHNAIATVLFAIVWAETFQHSTPDRSPPGPLARSARGIAIDTGGPFKPDRFAPLHRLPIRAHQHPHKDEIARTEWCARVSLPHPEVRAAQPGGDHRRHLGGQLSPAVPHRSTH